MNQNEAQTLKWDQFVVSKHEVQTLDSNWKNTIVLNFSEKVEEERIEQRVIGFQINIQSVSFNQSALTSQLKYLSKLDTLIFHCLKGSSTAMQF